MAVVVTLVNRHCCAASQRSARTLPLAGRSVRISESELRTHDALMFNYDVRSKVVHAGFSAVEQSQHQEIEQLALRAMEAIGKLVNQVAKHEALRELLHDRKMQ